MNHIYRSIWNESTQTWVAVSEAARAHGRASADGKAARVAGRGFALKALAAAGLLACGALALANPGGGTVSAGQATITTSGSKVTINQGSQNAAINWQSFSIGSGESVQFVQPNANSVALNRVVGGDASTILGSLAANGQVFLINPNGLLFGKGASVNVQGLVASTLGLSDADFMAGKYGFAGTSAKSVVNQGAINADGGYVALLGAKVDNQGTIAARLGTVALAGGQGVTLDVAGDSLLKVNVDKGAVAALVNNGGLIQADGGQVLMTAQAAGQLMNTVVNNTGVVQAQTVQSQGGVIKLLGDMGSGTVNVGGTLDASAPNGGNGGFIETSAATVNVAPTVNVTTAAPRPATDVTSPAPVPGGQSGTWLIDPADYTIAASGGNMTGTALGTALGTGNVTIASSSGTSSATSQGNIYIADTVAWSANQLTLTAANDIVVGTSSANGILNATGTSKLVLNTAAVTNGDAVETLLFTPASTPTGGINKGAYKGEINLASTSSFTMNGQAYTIITSLGSGPTDTTSGTLQGVNNGLTGHYVLGADIDATTTSGWASGAGFSPLGAYVTITDPGANGSPAPPYLDQTKTFTGVFEGLGHQVKNLTINTTTANGVGLFGVIGGQQIKTVGTVQTSGYGIVQDVTLVSPTVTGVALVGSLAGLNGGVVNNDYAIGTALVPAAPPAPAIPATNGAVLGKNNGSNYSIYVGGLVGENLYDVTSSYSSAAVSSTNATTTGGQLAGIVGGLVGVNADTVSNSSASGNVTGYQYVGGLAGQNGGTITNSSATGTVGAGSTGGGTQFGGLVGINSGTVTGTSVAGNTTTWSYATGNVTGTSYVGGLVGTNTGTVDLSYASGTASGTTDVGGLVGLNQGGNGGTGHAGTASNNGSVGATGFTATVTESYSSGAASGTTNVGGLVGANVGGNGGAGAAGCDNCKPGGAGGVGGTAVIDQSYSSATATGTNSVGGLVGLNYAGALGTAGANSANATTTLGLGGAGGSLGGGATVTDTYSNGAVSASGDKAGGLVGYNDNQNASASPAVNTPASVATSYTTSTVSGTATNKGLAIGADSGGTYTHDYYLTQGAQAAFGSGSSSSVSALSSSQMATASNFTGFNFETASTGGIWGIVGSNTRPTLCAITVGCTVELYIDVEALVSGQKVTSTSSVYGNTLPTFQDYLVTSNGTAFTLPSGVTATFSTTPNQATPSGGGTAVAPSLGTDAGSYVVTYKSGSLTFSGGDAAAQTLVNSYVLVPYGSGVNWTVNKAQLAVTAPTVTTRVYDGTTAATLTTSGTLSAVNNNTITGTGIYNGDDVQLTQASSGTFATKNAGSGITVTYTDALTGTKAGDYQLVQPSVTGTISPAPLVVSGTTVATKVYDGTNAATVSGGVLRPGTGDLIATTTGVLASDAGSVHLTAATTGTFSCVNVGCTSVTVTDALSGSAAGNYVLTQPTVTGTISPAPLTISGLSAANKTYDGTTAATVSGTAALTTATGNPTSGTGIVSGDQVSLASTAITTGQFATADAASHTQAVTFTDSLAGNQAGNYVLVMPALAATINPAPLVITGTTANPKTYDGTTAATLSNGVTAPGTGNTIGGNGVYSGDDVTLVQAGTFASPNAGGAQTVVVNDSLTGTKAHDYVLTQPGSVSAAISPAPLTVSGTQVADKTYDGNNVATLSGGTLAPGAGNTIGGTGVYNGDVGSVSLTTASTGTFASPNASPSAQAVSATDTLVLTGSAIGNYVLVQPTLTAFINPAPLTVTGLSAADKVYDGTATAQLQGTATLVAASGNNIGGSGVLAGDAAGVTLNTSSTGTFASPNASATPQAVATTDSLTLTGSAVGNYVLVQPAALTATISRAQLSVSGTSVAGKTYNGTTAAGVSGGALVAGANNAIGTATGVVAGDDVTLVQGGNFASPNASGSPQAVTSTDSLSGGAAGNYVLAVPTGLAATIAPAPLTVSGQTVATRTYNGTTGASLSGGVLASSAGNTIGGNGVLAADAAGVTLVAASTGSFASPNAGAGAQAVTVADGLQLSGSAVGNYVLVQPALAGFINPAPLTATGTTVVTKTYDGTNAAAIQGGTLAAASGNTIGGNGVYAGDAVNVTFTAATGGTFAGVNASTSQQAVTIADGLALSGSAVGNYVFVQPTVSGLITPAPLTVSGTSVASKTYNGSNAATLTGGSIVAASGNTIGGNGVLASDAANLSLVLASTGTFASVNASAAAQAVSVSDALSGSASSNYVLVQPALTGFINPAPLTVSGTTVNARTYDGTTTAVLSGGTLAPSAGNTLGGDGVLAGDAASVVLNLAATGNYAAADAGANARPVSVNDTLTLSGPAAGNYVLVQPQLSGVITQAPITVAGTTVVTKTYNGNNQATLTGGGFAPVNTGTASTSNTIAGNGVAVGDLANLVLNQAGTFAGSNASGSAQAVTAADSLSGSAAANYVLVEPTGLAGLIAPAPLTVGNTIVASKTYNGSNVAVVSGGQLVAGAGNTIGGSGVLSADAANVHLGTVATGTFASANASATPQAVTVADTLSLSGSAAGNYVLVQPTLSGTISPAPLTVTGTTVTSKTYDGTRSATLVGGTLAPVHTGNPATSDSIGTATGVLAADAANVTLVQGGNFASANAGTAAQSVTAADSLQLAGSAAGNYVLVQPTGLSGLISPAPITVSGATVVDRTYDGTTTATFSGGTLAPAAGNTIGGNGVVAADAANLRLTQAGTFASANASPNAQAVTASDALFGSASPNYVLVQPTGLAGLISPAPLTVSGTTVATRTYDGTTTATLSGGTLSAAPGNTIGGTGVLSADAAFVSLQTAPSGTFASPNAGTAAQAVSVTDTLTLTGTAAGNYVLVQPATLTGFINPAPLTVVGSTVVNKTFDGTNVATLAGGTLAPVVNGNPASSNNIATPTGVLASDAASVVLNTGGTFATANASSAAQAVTVHDTLTLSGPAAGNYVLVQPGNLSGTISPATLTITAAPNTKTYDGTTAALATPLVTGLATGTTLTGLSESYTSANVAGANGSTLVVNGGFVVNDGNYGNNYTVVTAGGTGTITPATLTVINTLVGNKVYDGTTATTVSGGVLVGLFGSDAVTLTQSGAFASANAGTAVPVVGSDSISGPAAGNYVLQQPAGLTGVISPAPLTVSGTTVATKVFDGSNRATLTGGLLVGLLPADAADVTLVQGGTFTSIVPSSSIPVIAGDSLAGSAAGNYTLAEPTGLVGNIVPNPLMPNAALLSVPLFDAGAPLLAGRTAPLTVAGADASAGVNVGTNAGTPAGTESNTPEKRRVPALSGLNISVVEDGIKLPATSGKQSP